MEPLHTRLDAESTAHMLVALGRAFREDNFATDAAREENDALFDAVVTKFQQADAAHRHAVWAVIDRLQGKGH